MRAHLKVRADTTVIPSAVGVRAVKLDDSCPGPGCVDRRLQFLLASIAGAGNVENPLQYVRTYARAQESQVKSAQQVAKQFSLRRPPRLLPTKETPSLDRKV